MKPAGNRSQSAFGTHNVQGRWVHQTALGRAVHSPRAVAQQDGHVCGPVPQRTTVASVISPTTNTSQPTTRLRHRTGACHSSM